MQKILWILPAAAIALSLSGCSFSNKEQTDVEKAGLRGPVKSYTEESYEAETKFGEITTGKIDSYSTHTMFNQKGYQTEFSTYWKSTLDDKTIFIYNEHNNLVEKSQYRATGALRDKTNYTYNAENKLIEECVCDADGDVDSKTIYTYNEDNILTTECQYDADGDMTYKIVYTYNTDNLLTMSCRYDASGELESKMTYDYDTNGNMLNMCSYESDGSVLGKTENTYDSNNRLQEAIITMSSGWTPMVIRSTFCYDKKGNMLSVGAKRTEHNESGATISEDSISIQYSHDAHGNWIEMIEFDEPAHIASTITKRTITYYE